MPKKTKIVATIGPASESLKTLKELIKEGVNVFRFNMKHGTIEWHEKTIEKAQKAADTVQHPIGIMIDLQGPEIRIKTRDEKDITLEQGDEVTFALHFEKGSDKIQVPHPSVFDALNKNDYIVIDDGFVQLKVTETSENRFKAKALEKAIIKNYKSMNLFGKDLDLPSLIEDDIERLDIAVKKKVDYVALSFVRTKNDVKTLRKQMEKRDIDAQVVAKIESQKGVDNIDEIIEESDVIMVARGDLGIETPIEKLAYYQREIINKCRKAGKNVIVATQMLESMIENPIPTRAEATDVANAVLQGTDAVMLSGETATGRYPVKAVQAMAKIAKFNEAEADVIDLELQPHNATELIVEAAEFISEKAQELKLDKIVVLTKTGYTARALASLRPKIPVLAVTDTNKSVETLTMTFGVEPIEADFPEGRLFSADPVVKQLKELGVLEKGEMVLIIHGQHWHRPGQTNAIVLLEVE